MRRMDITFTNEELLQIISNPGYGADVIFADGYDLAEAYPPFAAKTFEISFVLDMICEKVREWDITKPLETNWAQLYDSIVGKWHTGAACPTSAIRTLREDVGTDTGLQAAA